MMTKLVQARRQRRARVAAGGRQEPVERRVAV